MLLEIGLLLSRIMAEELQLDSVPVPWPDLPLLVLENIYSFLSRTDQANISLVCSRWCEGLDSPALWKTFTFDLTYDMLSKGNCALMKFAEKYSNLFRHVQIEHGLMPLHFGDWTMHFGTFLEILTCKSKLVSVSFRDLKYFFKKAGYHTYKEFCTKIEIFLGSQRRLKKLEFHKCSFVFREGVQLLKASMRSSGAYLSELKLHEFVHGMDESPIYGYWVPEDKQGAMIQQYLESIICFPNLKTVEIDYSTIFGEKANSRDVIEKLKNWQKRINLRLQLFLNESVDKCEILTETDWRILKKENPYLQVEMALFTYQTFQQKTEIFVVPNMPITHLTYEFRVDISQEQVDSFLRHLLSCNTNNHLVHFSLSVGPTIPSLIFSFIPFLNSCKNLKFFCLSTVYPVNRNYFDTFLNSFLKNQPKTFQHFQLEIFKTEDEAIAEDSKDYFRTLSNSLGLKYPF